MLADAKAKVPCLAIFVSTRSVLPSHVQVIPVNIKLIGILKNTFIAVTCTEVQDDTGTLGNNLVVDHYLPGGETELRMHDRIVTHHFL